MIDCLVIDCLVIVLSCLVLSSPVLSCLALSCHVVLCRVVSCLALPHLVKLFVCCPILFLPPSTAAQAEIAAGKEEHLS